MTSTGSLLSDQADLIRSLAVMCERPGRDHEAVAAALGIATPSATEYTELFVQQLPPYASIYLGAEGKIGGEARDRVAGFWRALELVPPAEPDHLASLLGLWAVLVEGATTESNNDVGALIAHSGTALVWEHLAPWLTPYLRRVPEISSGPLLAWADTLDQLLRQALVGTEGFDLPVHLIEEVSDIQDPEDLKAFILAPIRSGLLITRADLVRASSETRVGLRIGERAFALDSMLRQDQTAVVRWMAQEAERQADALATSKSDAKLKDFWVERARNTSNLLHHIQTT